MVPLATTETLLELAALITLRTRAAVDKITTLNRQHQPRLREVSIALQQAG